MCLCVWNWTLELCLTLSCPPSLVLSILHMAFIVSFLLPLSLPVSDTFICFLCLLSSLTPVWCSLWDINCFQVLWYRRLLCVMCKVTTKQRSENIHTCTNTQIEQSWTAGKSFEIKCISNTNIYSDSFQSTITTIIYFFKCILKGKSYI